MNKKIFFAGLFLIVACQITNAKIIRVNNNPGITQIPGLLYTTFASAHGNAVNGDTIHFEPSATAYPVGNVTKQLVLIGTGYYLAENAGLQANTTAPVIQNIVLYPGANGSKLLGLNFAGGSLYLNDGASDVLIERCQFAYPGNMGIAFNSGNSNNVTIRKCSFLSTSIGITVNNNLAPTNVLIENNIFAAVGRSINIPVTEGDVKIIRNNVFHTPASHQGSVFVNCYVANNIFASSNANPQPQTFTDCIVKHNFFQGNQTLPAGEVNNQVSVNMATVFVDSYISETGSIDSRLMLRSGSPAIGAGVTVGGITPDCGAYGGPNPYKLSGIPPVPAIYQLNLNATTVQPGGQLQGTFSTRNNN